MDAEVYKITTINSDGVAIVNYALPSAARTLKRMMLEEYGNVESEGMLIGDLPEDVKKNFASED